LEPVEGKPPGALGPAGGPSRTAVNGVGKLSLIGG
jgi:hypothetical protein